MSINEAHFQYSLALGIINTKWHDVMDEGRFRRFTKQEEEDMALLLRVMIYLRSQLNG